ncbi:MAG: PmoA family protein [Gemmataceae bacterium]|nr:PmoA family protein [Gemmataceae bacterium]
MRPWRYAVLPLLVVLPLFAADKDAKLEVKKLDTGGYLVLRAGQDKPIFTYHAPVDGRPFVHPILAPDGKGILTESSPDHHKHQTGLYVGFTRINGRDYFHNRGADYWKRTELTSAKVDSNQASWAASYDLLGKDKEPALAVTEQWRLADRGSSYVIDLDWSGKALTDIVWEKYDYGGLFLRMPWRQKSGGEAVNSDNKKNGACEGQKAKWVNVGMPIEGRDDWGNIAILDHKDNPTHPTLWRVDGQLGVGPARSRAGEWKLPKGEVVRFRYRFLVQTGKVDEEKIEAAWKDWVK